MRRYSCHVIAAGGRFFKAGEDVTDDVTVAGCAEKYRIREDEQPDESDPRKSTAPSECEPPDRHDLI